MKFNFKYCDKAFCVDINSYEKIDYKQLDYLCYCIRTNLICEKSVYEATESNTLREYQNSLNKLLNIKQDEITNEIVTAIPTGKYEHSPYYEVIWYYLYNDKNLSVSNSNFNRLIDNVLNSENGFEYHRHHPLNLILATKKKIDKKRLTSILNICQRKERYFEEPFDVAITSGTFDWRYYALSRKDIPTETKEQILSTCFSDANIIDATTDIHQELIDKLISPLVVTQNETELVDNGLLSDILSLTTVYQSLEREYQNRKSNIYVKRVGKKY